MLILKKILFVTVFLVVWIGSIFLYAANRSGVAKESEFLAISLFWVLVFVKLARKIFRNQTVDPETAASAGIAQVAGTDSFDDMDFDV